MTSNIKCPGAVGRLAAWASGRSLPAATLLMAVLAWPIHSAAAEPAAAAATGPATEKRFPPLVLPDGFTATLFACDPLVEYPSAIALGPRPGTLFVAADFMTGLGTEIVRRDEIRLVEDVDGDGYADRATVYADGFNSIQGLTFHDGTVYAMHSPHLTALADTDGDGVADQRRDLATGLGLPPEKNPVRLHCANGLAMGHDGWLYLALGDHGCDVSRVEGDRLVLHGGGILRCRADGSHLHVFSTGLRNIYDVVLDDELNVFVRDNENDGGDYKIRVCHSFFGADHGYPYLYYERPDEALAPLADLGLGSSAGGVCYRENQFPSQYRGALFFCEWGKSVVVYRPRRERSGFARLEETEFATGAANDPYGFKPTDLVVDRDGSLLVADWADGQQPKRGRARIYRITSAAAEPNPPPPAPASAADWIAQLGAPGYYRRAEAQRALEAMGADGLAAVRAALVTDPIGPAARMHAIWALSRIQGAAAAEELLELARTQPNPRVQVQALRALADVTDPVLAAGRLDAGAPEARLAARVADWAGDEDPRVMLEAINLFGRLRWSGAPAWLNQTLKEPDPFLAHAAMRALRRADNWPAVLALVDQDSAHPVRLIALRAMANQAAAELADGLIDRIGAESEPARRIEYAELLGRICNKPAPWEYWGFRPAPRPANPVAWEATPRIEQALNRLLADPDTKVRADVLARMQREKISTQLVPLTGWLKEESDAAGLAAILEALRRHPPAAAREALAALVIAPRKPAASRLAALEMFCTGLEQADQPRLVTLAAGLEESPVKAEAIRQITARPDLEASELFLAALSSPDPDVRAAAVDASAARRLQQAAEAIARLLSDGDVQVRRAAAAAAGALALDGSAETLLALSGDADAGVRRECLESLRILGERRALPLAVAALENRATRHAALKLIADLGGPDQASAVMAVASHDFSAEVFALALKTLSKWSGPSQGGPAELESFIRELQGNSGTLAQWHVTGPMSAQAAERLVGEGLTSGGDSTAQSAADRGWQITFGSGTDSTIVLPALRSNVSETGTIPGRGPEGPGGWLAYADFSVFEPADADTSPGSGADQPAAVQFLSGADGGWKIWLNGSLVHQRDAARTFAADSEPFDSMLSPGVNRLAIYIEPVEGRARFHVRFRRKSSAAHEQYVQAALTSAGDAQRGRDLFFNVEKSRCIKCHRLGEQGERIGPELTAVGGRFSRVHLVESVLEPSRSIAPVYQGVLLVLADGRTMTGIVLQETSEELTLADAQGARHVLAKSQIDERQPSALSIMPEDLEKSLSVAEFVDLIAFLVGEK